LGSDIVATSRSIKGALRNFLSTYTSRYSDYDGYWLFGFLVPWLDQLSIDLLGPSPTVVAHPLQAAIRTAIERFHDQLRKAGLDPARLGAARLVIRKLAEPVEGFVNGCLAPGFHVVFAIHAVTTSGRRYESDVTTFVAPHDPSLELRSTRAPVEG
jgi:hypothetical protein